MNVIYNGNFSADERTVLEQNLVPNLIDSRNGSVEKVYVNQKDAATLDITISYSSGFSVIYTYSVGANGNLALTKSTVKVTQ